MRELLLCLILSVNTLCAQVLIRGTVLDNETKAPLPYAHIILLNENMGTLSNNDGYFEIKPENDTAQLQVSYIGYETKIIRMTTAKINEPLDIRLIPKAFTLNEVVISPDRIYNLIKAIYNKYKIRKDEQYSAYAFYRSFSAINNFPVVASEIFYKIMINQSGIGNWDFIQGRSAESSKIIEQPSIHYHYAKVRNPPFYNPKKSLPGGPTII